ncbi:PorT family protein [Hymenobacter sp. BT683]|uniref:PorT family protein n=1 Tax=Hymenobacter jeongseonensis TaxID=2791027 RepID=A0ABS0IDN3_9BACT|nr:porin family protein [Hymenobacter jeongseonensis]MBF9236461.1 PorT family protein [Hymenobacter jeongseonensis]
MKKNILCLLLIAGLHGAAHAQRNRNQVSLGLKAGGSVSSFSGAQAPNDRVIPGFHAGAFANITLSDLFAFQPEILYSQKGAEVPDNNVTTRLGYVDVPLAFHVNTGGFFFEAGPQVGLLISAKNKTGTTSVDRSSRYNTVDLGYLAGLGYQRKRGLGVGLRYNGGITNIEKAATSGTTTVQRNIRNSVFQLYLTYSFSNGRRR